MNKAIIIGRAVRDCEVRTTPSNKSVATFTLAVDRDYKNEQGEREADYLPCVVWGKLAEIAGKYVTKGKQCAVIGRIQTRSYEGNDGTKKYITEIIVSELQLLGSRQDGQAQQPQQPQGGFEVDDSGDPLPF